MQIQASWEFGFLHFYPEIFFIISSFSTFVSKVSYSRIKYILLLAQSRDPIVFHGPGLPPIDAPLKKAIPKRECERIGAHWSAFSRWSPLVLHGNGASWWGYIQYLVHGENRPRLLSIINATDILVEKWRFVNSAHHHTLCDLLLFFVIFMENAFK